MATIRIGNAPVSFGIFEPEFGETRQLGYDTVLEMIAAAGYEGTELGPYGYLPTDPQELTAAVRRHNLALGSSFVPVDLANPAALRDGCERVLTVARLLATQRVPEVIIADVGDEQRKAAAGMSPPGWTAAQWAQVEHALATIAQQLHQTHGMRVVVHHHAGTYLETPAEIERLLQGTEPGLVDLLLDTGHYVYGGGDPLELLQRHRDRVRYVHYKDVDAALLERVRRERIDMATAWRQDVFVPLGRGCIDFGAITELLRAGAYEGWIIVEQDTVADDEGGFLQDPFACAKNSRSYLRELGL